MTEVVRIEDVTKQFTIRKQKSFKEALVNAKQGRLHTERFTALDHVSATISAGDSVGLIGPNGSGKSTLLKLIGGILAPDSGRVTTRGRLAALLELGAGFHPDLSGRENVFLNAAVLGLTDAETRHYFDEIVDFSEIGQFIDTQVKFYSSGMYVRLAFAVAVHVDPDILLVDEVLAVGDEPFQAKCMDKIRQFQRDGRTIVFVSHSPGQVADLCDRAILLQHGQVIEDSTPAVALGRLHSVYQPSIDSARDESADRSPHAGRLERAFLSHPSQDATADIVLAPGDGLSVHCEAVFPEPVAGWAFRVRVEDSLGTLHTETDSRSNLQQSLPAAAGAQRFVVTLPGLWLGEGDYSVAVSLRDADDLPLHEARAGAFAVRGRERSSGPVYCDPRLDFA
jgi:ABC-2 type transport system ATP-binding protein